MPPDTTMLKQVTQSLFPNHLNAIWSCRLEARARCRQIRLWNEGIHQREILVEHIDRYIYQVRSIKLRVICWAGDR
jgi:hypothetical protein